MTATALGERISVRTFRDSRGRLWSLLPPGFVSTAPLCSATRMTRVGEDYYQACCLERSEWQCAEHGISLCAFHMASRIDIGEQA